MMDILLIVTYSLEEATIGIANVAEVCHHLQGRLGPEQPSPPDHHPKAPSLYRCAENACRPFPTRAKLGLERVESKTSFPPPAPSNYVLNR